jgi:hypothetical protein
MWRAIARISCAAFRAEVRLIDQTGTPDASASATLLRFPIGVGMTNWG